MNLMKGSADIELVQHLKQQGPSAQRQIAFPYRYGDTWSSMREERKERVRSHRSYARAHARRALRAGAITRIEVQRR